MNSEENVLEFAANTFRSVWALEMLLLIRRSPERRWAEGKLIAELRSSSVVIAESIANLVSAGLACVNDDATVTYHARSPEIDAVVVDLDILYAQKPTLVVRHIVMSKNAKLKLLSDAFRIVRE